MSLSKVLATNVLLPMLHVIAEYVLHLELVL